MSPMIESFYIKIARYSPTTLLKQETIAGVFEGALLNVSDYLGAIVSGVKHKISNPFI